MSNARRVCTLAIVIASASVPVLAQTPAQDPNAPPKVLAIFREEVKPGRGAAHEANEAGWPAAFTKAQWPVPSLAVTSITGPSEAWFFTGYPSLEAMEADGKAQEANQALMAEMQRLSALDGEMLTRTSQVIATYVPELSYQPNGVANLVDKRYFSIETVRVKPGHGREFFENWRALIAAHEKAKMAEHWSTYAVDSGAAAGTYMFIYAFSSLKEADAAGPMHADTAYRDAVGEAGRARNREATQAAVEFSQRNLYAFSPKMSYPPKAFTDADPGYWAPKAAAPAVAAKKPVAKSEKKPGA